MKHILAMIFFSWAIVANAALTDIKFGRYQIADSQWNVSACLYTATCQIYSKNPGTAYKIPWTSGQVVWAAGDYIKFELSGNASFPYLAKQYNSAGNVKATMGTGKIVNMGPDYFFFVGNDNNTGQLFSGSSGMSGTGGVTWTGTMSPTIQQADTYANATYSTVPLSSGQTATQTPSNNTPTPTPTAITTNSSNAVYITNFFPTSNNSPPGEDASKAFDGNPNTKYLNFDNFNAGVTVKLNAGRVVTGFTLTTANDFPGRDPTSYKLYGSNDGTTWTLISDGPVSLSNNRFQVSSMISVTNSTAYIYYYIFFPTTKAGTGCGLDCNSMQIAEITFYYDANNTTTSTASVGGSVVNPGSLCCGGSAAAFSANVGVSSRISNFANNANTLGDNRVIITQIGNNNTVAVTQSGVRNYADLYIKGSNNSVTSNQTVAGANVLNFVEQDLVGSNNTVNYSQTGTGGSKAISTEIYSNGNNVSVQQKDSGSHHAEISLSGGNKSVTLTQQGSAGHMARIELSGGATSITATQSGSTQQHYSITHNCATSSCSAITVTQGQQ
jgi:hypothetical protein